MSSKRFEQRIQPIKQKRFYYLLKGLDYSTYKAYDRYKSTIKTNERTIRYLRATLSPVAPFGGKSKRFIYEPQINTIDNSLKGTLKRYHTNTISRNFNCGDAMKESSIYSSKKSIGSSIAYNVKVANDMNGKRTIDPSTDLFASYENLKIRRRYNKDRHTSMKKSASVGSLSTLFDKTPLYNKTRTNSITKDSGLFTKEYNTINPVYKHKAFVDLEEIKKIGNNYAGNVSKKKKDNSSYKSKYSAGGSRNIARERKLKTLQSDIFNTKLHKNEYEYEYNAVQRK